MHNGKPNPSIARKDWDECIELSSKDSSWWFQQSNSRYGQSNQMVVIWMKFKGFELMVSKWTKRIWWLMFEWSYKVSSWWFRNGPSKSDGWHWMKLQGFQLMVSKWTKQIWWLTLKKFQGFQLMASKWTKRIWWLT